MAQAVSTRASDRARAASPIRTLAERKHELTRTLDAKVVQGNRIESQDATSAVVRRPGRRRWFGFVSGMTVRSLISVDERGHTTSRKIEA